MARKKIVGIMSITMSLCVLIASSVLLVKICSKFVSTTTTTQDCTHQTKNELQNFGGTKSYPVESKSSSSAGKNKGSRQSKLPLGLDPALNKCPKKSTKKKPTTIRNITTTAIPLVVKPKKTPTHPLRLWLGGGRRKRSTTNSKRQQQLQETITIEYRRFLILTISTIVLGVVQVMAGVISFCPRIQASQTCIVLWAFLNALLILFFIIMLGASFYLAQFLKIEFKIEYWTFICVLFGDLLILALAVFILSQLGDPYVSSSHCRA